MYREFTKAFPQYEVTEQRIADQRRAIEKNNLISAAEREEIKKEIANKSTQQLIRSTETNEAIISQPEEIQELEEDQTEKLEMQERIEREFEQAEKEYYGVEPEKRPLVPKLRPNAKLRKILQIINTAIIPKRIQPGMTLIELADLTYCPAITTVRTLNVKLRDRYTESNRGGRTGEFKPQWQRRIEKQIEDIRVKLGRLTQYQNGNRSRRLENRIGKIMREEAVKTHSKYEKNGEIGEFIDTLKQKLCVMTGRLRRYKVSNKRRNDARMFNRNEKLFYRKLKEPKANHEEDAIPEKQKIREFWEEIWTNEDEHDDNAVWIEQDNS